MDTLHCLVSQFDIILHSDDNMWFHDLHDSNMKKVTERTATQCGYIFTFMTYDVMKIS